MVWLVRRVGAGAIARACAAASVVALLWGARLRFGADDGGGAAAAAQRGADAARRASRVVVEVPLVPLGVNARGGGGGGDVGGRGRRLRRGNGNDGVAGDRADAAIAGVGGGDGGGGAGVWVGTGASERRVDVVALGGTAALPTREPWRVVLANGKIELVVEGAVGDNGGGGDGGGGAGGTVKVALASVRNTLVPGLPAKRLRKGLFIMVVPSARGGAGGGQRAAAAQGEIVSNQCEVINATTTADAARNGVRPHRGGQRRNRGGGGGGDGGGDGGGGGQAALTVSALTVDLSCPRGLVFRWEARLGPADAHATVTLQWALPARAGAAAEPLAPSFVLLAEMPSVGVRPMGTVLGSPIAAEPSRLFFAVAHPLGAGGVMAADPTLAVCGSAYVPSVTPEGDGVTPSSHGLTLVAGAYTEPSQLRREFAAYVDATRASPPRPMLHYNSWFDFASWQEPNASLNYRKMTEAICLDRVERFGKELVRKRGVTLDSFLLDDGWDNQSSLWKFNKQTFPHGFDRVGAAAKGYGAGIGVWLSPWGGYGEAKDARLASARAQGYETALTEAGEGFTLSGKKYFRRFHDIMLNMVTRYGVNMFKVDGIGFEGDHSVIATEMAGMLSLVAELRSSSLTPLFVSLTTGTWPSPFWLQHGDTIWRGHGDLGLEGPGSARQQWTTYRDAVVYHLVHRRAPLFPLSALMLHGIVVGAVGQARAAGLDTVGDIRHFRQEVWSYFGMGVHLQELYLSPDRMTPLAWDAVADAAKWARSRRATLADAHWVGGDPLSSAYGFASWSAPEHRAVVLLRNPTDAVVVVDLRLGDDLELPRSRARAEFAFVTVYDSDGDGGGGGVLRSVEVPAADDDTRPCASAGRKKCVLPADATLKLRLGPLSVVLIEGTTEL